MPGRNTSTSPVVLGQRPADGARRRRVSSAVVAPARQPAHVDRMSPPVGDDDRGARRPSVAEQPGELRRVGRRRHRQDAQVGTQRRGDVERQGEAEVGGEVALVDLVEDHRGDAGQLGIVLQPAGQHALGEHLDPRRRADPALVARLVADELADAPAGRSAIRRAAARVANRRGSRTTIRPSRRHAASSRASGTIVVLPAPGGALTTARGRCRGPRRCGRARRRSAGSGTVGRNDSDRAQASAGVPWNGPGSPTSGMSGASQAVVAAIASATARHSPGSIPRRRPARCRRPG